MFRDPTYFRALREKVAPHLRTYPSLKVWVAGCSSGEELYSLVILFREEGLESRTLFYATDINQDALTKAAAGIYNLDRMQLFTENHRKSGGKSSLSNYYSAAYGGAALDKFAAPARRVFRSQSRDGRRFRRSASDILPQCVDLFRPRAARPRARTVPRFAAATGISRLGLEGKPAFFAPRGVVLRTSCGRRRSTRSATHDREQRQSRGHRRIRRRDRGAVDNPAGLARRLSRCLS